MKPREGLCSNARRGVRFIAVLVVVCGVAACAGILGIRKRDSSRPFEHHRHSIAGVSCLQCHAGVQAAGDDGPLHLPATSVCVGCHTAPHDRRACENCHGTADARSAAAGARKYLRFEHRTHLPAVKGQCIPCHNEAGAREASQLRPAMAQCFTCHQHKDQFAIRDCDRCHHDLPSQHLLPTSHVVHEGNWLREHGVRAATARDLCATCHSESSCDACHGVTVPILPWRLEVELKALDHLHPAGFRARHPEEARAQPGLCTTCHAESFCLDCHMRQRVSAGTGGGNPHPPGWVRAVGGEHGRAARLDPLACASCHGGAGEMLCVGCHKVGGAGGNPHGPGFSSKRDQRKDEPCRLCHAL